MHVRGNSSVPWDSTRWVRAGPITLAGHSLGGTLAKLLAALLVADGRTRPADIACHTYGSPAAFATSGGGRGTAVMHRLGLRNGQIRNWVLAHDPIPRAWTEANSYLQMALQVQVRSPRPMLASVHALDVWKYAGFSQPPCSSTPIEAAAKVNLRS